MNKQELNANSTYKQKIKTMQTNMDKTKEMCIYLGRNTKFNKYILNIGPNLAHNIQMLLLYHAYFKKKIK